MTDTETDEVQWSKRFTIGAPPDDEADVEWWVLSLVTLASAVVMGVFAGWLYEGGGGGGRRAGGGLG